MPVIPFDDVVGKAASVSPAQIGPTAANVGAVLLFTPMVMVAVAAHNPAFGVNV